MALRTKTIEYAFPTDTASLAAATRRDLSAVTLYVPETSSRTFRSVSVEVTVSGDDTAAASMTSWLIGIKLGAVAFNDATVTLTLTNSGDPQGFVFTRDVTSYFATNFGAGASQTCQVGLQFGALATRNHTVKLIITYEYDDASATTRVRTARIPLESNTAQLTATLATVGGTGGIPALDTFLPEASKVYRSIWLEFIFNDAGNAVTDIQLGVRIAADVEVNVFYSEQALNGGRFGKAIWDVTTAASWSTASAQTLQARSNATASRFSLLGIILHVTYEYDHSTSTRVLNSLVLPAADATAWPGNTAAADKSRFERVVWIEEPGTITLVQSGLLCTLYDPGTVTINILAGSQTARAYVCTTGSVFGGPYVITHRIDSGSGGGAFGTLARGRNTIDIDWYSTVASAGSNFSAMLFLNYTSDIHTDGDGAHAHSTAWTICDAANALTNQRNISAPTALFAIPETSYYTTGIGFHVMGVMVGSAISGIALQAERQSAEGPGAGWVDFAVALQRADGEAGVQWSVGAAREEWQRWPSDPDAERMALETTRQYRICTASTMTLGVRAWLSYHAITFAVAGSITGSSGGTVTITVHRTASGEKVGSTSRVGDGAYSLTWYDNTETLYAVARESAVLLGRSDDTLAS